MAQFIDGAAECTDAVSDDEQEHEVRDEDIEEMINDAAIEHTQDEREFEEATRDNPRLAKKRRNAVDEVAERYERAQAAEEKAQEEEEEVYEMKIKGKSYYVSNEKNGKIYGIDENGDVADEVGKMVNGKAIFG